MKFYFTASMRDSHIDSSKYLEIVQYVEELGHENLNYIHTKNGSPEKKKYAELLESKKKGIYEIQSMLINESDVLIADVTQDTVTVGYQIDYALRRKIPVLALYNQTKQKKISPVLKDNHAGLLSLKPYATTAEQKKQLREFMMSVTSGKIKFNFFIGIPIHNYITQRANKENTSKSDVIRKIISDEMGRDLR